MELTWIVLTFVAIALIGAVAVLALVALVEKELADARKPSPLFKERQRLREETEPGLWTKIERECL